MEESRQFSSISTETSFAFSTWILSSTELNLLITRELSTMKILLDKNYLLSSISEQCLVIVCRCCKAMHLRSLSLRQSVVGVGSLLSLAGLLPEYGDPLVVVVDHALLVLVQVLDEGELEAGRRTFQPL